MQSTATLSLLNSERVPLRASGSEVGEVVKRRERYAEVESEVLRRAQLGDAQAMTRVVRLYEARVFAFLSRATGHGSHVEDLAQEVFLRVFRALPRYVAGEAKFSTWVFQIAIRLVQDRRKRVTPVLVAVDDSIGEVGCSPEALIDDKRSLSRIQELAAELPDGQRMALILFEFHGFSYEEIAGIMGCPNGTVKTRVHRAREFLKRGLAQLRKGGI